MKPSNCTGAHLGNLSSVYPHTDRNTPRFQNKCGHPPETWVGSVRFDERAHMSYKELDIYMEADLSICIRVGDEPSEYYSPGKFFDLLFGSLDNHLYNFVGRYILTKRQFTIKDKEK